MKNLVCFVLLATMISSCADQQVVEPTVDRYGEVKAREGDTECLELVYPVSLRVGDQLVEIESDEAWRSFWDDWKQQERDAKPELVYPLEVKFKGDIKLIESEDLMISLKKKCAGDIDQKDRVRCFKIVFPISLELPDGSVAQVEDEKEWHEVVKQWFEDNPDSAQKPSIAYPIDVIAGDRLLTIDSDEAFAELKERCNDADGERDRVRCYALLYPVSIALPDGSIAQAQDDKEWKQLVREWIANNQDSDARPMLQYPVQVKLRDGSIITIEDSDSMMRLKKRCAGDEKGGRERVRVDRRN